MIDRKQLYISEDGQCNIFLVESNEDIPLHKHDVREIMTILNGRGTLELNNGKEKKDFGDNDILTVEPLVEHRLVCKAKTKGIVMYVG